ncbi:MAG: DUF6089 family protein [Cyclobacteriaceae bacterium]
MKKIFFFSVMLLFSVSIFSQNKFEMGIFAGTSYYLGDINPSRQFYSVAPSFGGLMRYNFTDRYALRLNGLYGGLSADDLDFDNGFQQQRAEFFNTNFFEVDLQLEFNFMPFFPVDNKILFSPYVFSGVGYSLLLARGNHQLILPMGIGFKYSFRRKITLNFEWGFRKTFADNLDGVSNFGSEDYTSAFHNNDWYSVAGIGVSFRLFDSSGNCPVYE